MKLVIITQCRENYGAHDWDGKGECPQRWKNKGGAEYILEDLEHYISINDEFFTKKVRMIVDEMRPNLERQSVFYEETIINYTIEDDDFQPEFELQQLEHTGMIRFYEPRIDIEGNRIFKQDTSVPTNIVMSDN